MESFSFKGGRLFYFDTLVCVAPPPFKFCCVCAVCVVEESGERARESRRVC